MRLLHCPRMPRHSELQAGQGLRDGRLAQELQAGNGPRTGKLAQELRLQAGQALRLLLLHAGLRAEKTCN